MGGIKITSESEDDILSNISRIKDLNSSFRVLNTLWDPRLA